MDDQPYGQCHICGGKIQIPGLDYYLCGGKCKRYILTPKAGKIIQIKNWKSSKKPKINQKRSPNA